MNAAGPASPPGSRLGTSPRGMGRGQSILTALVLLSLAGLTGCDRKPAGSAARPDPEVGPGTPPVRLVLLAMEDYVDAGILRQFEQETGIGIDHVLYEDPDEITPRLRSQPGSADIIIVDSFTIKSLRELRLLCPLRRNSLANLENIDPRHRGLSFDPEGEYSLPYHWGTTLIAYRSDLIKNPAHSWQLLWQPALKGRVMMIDDTFEPMAIAMILNGIDPQSPEETDYQRASDIMIDHLVTMGARYGTDDQVKDALVDGSISAAMCYSGDAAVAAAENPNIDFFIPEEGAMMWVDCLAICRDTQNAALAHRFLDFFLRPEIAARNAEVINYAPANQAATPLISEELRNDPRIYPPAEIRSRLQHVPTLDEERQIMARRYWHRVRSRLLGLEEAAATEHTASREP